MSLSLLTVRGLATNETQTTQQPNDLPAEVFCTARPGSCPAHAVRLASPRRGFPSRPKNDSPRNHRVKVKPCMASPVGEGTESEANPRLTQYVAAAHMQRRGKGIQYPAIQGSVGKDDRWARLDENDTKRWATPRATEWRTPQYTLGGYPLLAPRPTRLPCGNRQQQRRP